MKLRCVKDELWGKSSQPMAMKIKTLSLQPNSFEELLGSKDYLLHLPSLTLNLVHAIAQATCVGVD